MKYLNPFFVLGGCIVFVGMSIDSGIEDISDLVDDHLEKRRNQERSNKKGGHSV